MNRLSEMHASMCDDDGCRRYDAVVDGSANPCILSLRDYVCMEKSND
jgi:hypothetical protein